MKAYPVKHLIVRHSLKKSSSKRCCHLPLTLWLFFSSSSHFLHSLTVFPPHRFIQNSITLEEGSARKMGHSFNTLRAPSWPWGMHLPLTFAHKQFQQSTTEALLPYYSSPGWYWDDDLSESLMRSLAIAFLILGWAVHAEDPPDQFWTTAHIWRFWMTVHIFVECCPDQTPTVTDSKKQ